MTDPARLEVHVPRDLVDQIAAKAAALAADMVAARPEPWITVAQAADHLACPKSRIYSLVSARRIPFHKDSSRVLFKASELDRWVLDGGGVRPG
jgi:excisionase family DNA binding protein